MKWGAGPCGTTSAVSLPWNIGRTNAVCPSDVLNAITSVMIDRSIRAASFGAKSRVWYVCGRTTSDGDSESIAACKAAV